MGAGYSRLRYGKWGRSDSLGYEAKKAKMAPALCRADCSWPAACQGCCDTALLITEFTETALVPIKGMIHLREWYIWNARLSANQEILSGDQSQRALREVGDRRASRVNVAWDQSRIYRRVNSAMVSSRVEGENIRMPKN